MMRLVLCGALAAPVAACSSQSPVANAPVDAVPLASSEAASPQTAEAVQLQLACLTPANELQQIKACTAAINSGALSQKELSNALAVRGTLYLRLMRLTDARIDLEQAKRLDPANPTIDQGLALLETADRRMTAEQRQDIQALVDCSELPDLSARIAACDRLVARAQSDPKIHGKALAARALAKLLARDVTGAVADLDKAAILDPGNASLRDYRSRALFMAERYEEALPGLEAAIVQNPYEPLVKSMIGAIYYVRGDLRRAHAEFEAMRNWEVQEGVPGVRAATVQAELTQDESAFEQLAGFSLAPPPTWLKVLAAYRSSSMPDAEFRSEMENALLADERDIGCLVEFHIAHKAALEQMPGAARAGFAKAAELCGPGNFEYHAAKKWLLKLGPRPNGRRARPLCRLAAAPGADRDRL